MPPPTTASYERLRARITQVMDSMGRPPIVAISGHGGAGKTTLAARLMTDLGGQPHQVVRTDRLYASTAGPDSGVFDLHDWPTIRDLLRRLRTLPPPTRLTYPVRTYEGVEQTCDVPMPPVVIIEGIRLLRPETMPLFDLAVWIDLSPEAAGARAVERNRGQGDSAAELDLWRTKWIPEAHAYAEATRPDHLAHLVLADSRLPSARGIPHRGILLS